MSAFPLRYADQNLLLGPGGHSAALYRLSMTCYPFLGVSEKWFLQRRLARLAQTIAADFSLWRVQRAYPADRYVDHAAGLLDERHQSAEVWRSYLQGHGERLAALDSHVPECYLAVCLDERPSASFGASLLRVSDRLRARAEDVLSLHRHAPIPASELQALHVREQRLYERLASVITLRRALTSELQWLLARAPARGLGEPQLDAHWAPQALVIKTADQQLAYEPLEQVLWRTVNAAITERERGLVIDCELGRSHQALLALGALGEDPQFPGAGAELLFAPLESLGFPVDAVLHVSWLANREALSQVRKRIADVEHAYREQLEGAAFGPGLQAAEDRLLAREYEAELQSGAHPAMLRGWIGLALGAASEQELDRRVSLLSERYGDVTVHRPAALQRQLFFDHLPRADGGATSDYVAQLTVAQFGAMVPTATRALGDGRGPYLGYTPAGTPLPIRYDPAQAPRRSRASAVLLVGTLGSGKTVAAQAIAYGAQRRGSLVVDFDPKPDHGWHKLPELADSLEVLELSGAPAQQGRLDPLTVGIQELREELACSYLLELLRDPPPSWENAINRAVRDAVREGSSGLLDVVARLLASDQGPARDAGQALEVIADFGLARLGFGSGSDSSVRASSSLTSIRMPGLTLPDPQASRAGYTRSERVSVATLTLVASYALALICHDRSRHKVVLLDEIWFLLASAQGRSIIDRLVRLGRAFNATVLLGTQRSADLGELADLIGVYLLFGQDSDAEARRSLELIGLDSENSELVRMTRELRRGRCLMRDLDGRVGEVQVDLVYPHLLDAFETSPPPAGAPTEPGQDA